MARRKTGKLQLSVSAQKVAELVESTSAGNQRGFARLVGCAQPVISRILNGKQQPGRDLLERIAKLENVNRDELIATLEAQEAIDRVTKTLVPVACALLDSHPRKRIDQLTSNKVAVSPAIFRSSLYTVHARVCEPAFSNPSEQMRADDLIVIETSIERLRTNLQALNGKLCVVVTKSLSGQTITLRRVWMSHDDSSNTWT
ncbi:MAG: helix-turn-helix transcriptional regulator, partial [Planctomycetaceae bacterium]|nr:helix-turn-helix transcriptional regulator [Planctomycetaceae bacterium]